MGFFDFLFGSKNKAEDTASRSGVIYKDSIKEKDADGFYPIICPHCLNKFKIWEAEFRAFTGGASTNLWGDVDEDLNYFPAEVDEKFDAFEKNISGATGNMQGKILKLFDSNGDPAGEVQTVTLMNLEDGTAAETLRMENLTSSILNKRPIYSVVDKYNRRHTQRVCPHCHHVVANAVGIFPSYIIGIVGNTMCGKSVFLETLGGKLSEGILLGDHLTGLAAEGKDWSIRLREMRAKADRGEGLLMGTSIKFMPPNIFTCSRAESGERFLLNIFDFPGEAIRAGGESDSFRSQYITKIPEVDGWMFLFDSGSFNTVYEALDATGNHRYLDVLEDDFTPIEILNSFRSSYLEQGPFTVPVAFVVTKIDLVRHTKSWLMDNKPGIIESNPVFLMENNHQEIWHQKHVDLDDISECASRLENLFSANTSDAIMLRTAQNAVDGGRAAWFGVSSTGAPVEKNEKAARGTPLRVTEPLQWLLWMLGIVGGEGENYPSEWDN